MKDLWIITIVNSISQTSMPVNEFVIFRANNFICKQTLISIDKNIPDNIKIPSNVELINIGKNYHLISSIIKIIENKAKNHNLKTIYHLHQPKSAILFYLFAGNIIKNKNLFTVHNTFKDQTFKYKILSFCSALFSYKMNAVSKTAYEKYCPLIKKIKGNNFFCIQNGVDFQRVSSINISEEKDRKKLVCIARINPIKNQKFLLKLLKKLPDFKLILIGAIYDNEIIDFVYKENLQDRVEFSGLISREEVFKKTGKCGIYVSTSLVEGLPLSVLEAMSLGLIPVLSNIGPHLEIKELCEYVNVLPLQEELWLKKIMYLSNLSNAEYNEISNIIKENVKNNFSLDIMHKKYFEIYENLLK